MHGKNGALKNICSYGSSNRRETTPSEPILSLNT